MDAQRPLTTEMARAHSNSAPPAIRASPNTSPADWHSDTAEDETCRICKSEATPDQPLFYPCKCSGSIKYVHQDCLMEWLERSQKKHCELCKTPFRFTKLYERDMPSKLPLGLFVKHMLLHAGETAKLWARGALVSAVWLVGLPWVMRHIWAVLFYIADGGWWVHTKNEPHPVLGAAIEATRAGYKNYGTSFASPLFKETSTNAKITAPMNTFWKFFVDQANNNATFQNLSYKDVMRAMFYPAAFNSYGLPPDTRTNTSMAVSYPDSATATAASFAMKPEMISPQNNDSILGHFSILQNLTKNKSLNRLIITILEGQIITIIVVICFILIFLIREWVVQQQPGINIGAGFNAEFPNPAREGEEGEEERLMRVREEGREELQRMIRDLEDQGRALREPGAPAIRPPTPPIARRDGDDERERAEWREMEGQARMNGAHYRRREEGPNGSLGTTDGEGEFDRQREGVDENGDLIPVIGTTRDPTTEYLLRGKHDEEKKSIVHDKLFEHVRFIIPGIAGKVTDLMMQEGVHAVLHYIDYEDEIHIHLAKTLLKYNQKLLDEAKDPILTKQKGKEHILEALVSQLAEDHHARDMAKVVRVFMGLELTLLLRILGEPNSVEKMVRDLDMWHGPGPDEERGEWVTRVKDTTSFFRDLEQPEVLEAWEDEESDPSETTSRREVEYRAKVRTKRESRDSSVYVESEDEDEPIDAPRGYGGVSPERARYNAKLAARVNGQSASRKEEPFKFNFSSHDIELSNAKEKQVFRSQQVPLEFGGPSSRHEAPQFQPVDDAAIANGTNSNPTPWEEREVSAEDLAKGVVGYTRDGAPLISDAELMRRINGDSDSEEASNRLSPPLSTAGPSSRHFGPQFAQDIEEAITDGMNAAPTPRGNREVSAEDKSREDGPLFSNIELMRLADDDDEAPWASDNNPTTSIQDEDETQEESAIETEPRTSGEIVETARMEAVAEAARIEAVRPRTFAEKLAHWLWGDVEAEAADAGVDDEHIVDDINAEAPFVPVNHGHHDHHQGHDHGHAHDDRDHDHDEAPAVEEGLANAGFADDLDALDPEAIDEAEDFDGIMELVGMRGPVFGLIQNCLIGIILLAITIFLGIWIPYIVGKVVLLLTANPVAALKLPLRLIFKTAAVMQDVALVFFGGCYYTFIKGISIVFSLFGKQGQFLAEKNSGIAGLGAVDAVMYAGSALERVIADLILAFSPDSEIPYFSAAAHESLIYLRSLLSSIFSFASVSKLFQVTTSESGMEIAPLIGVLQLKELAMNVATSSLKWCVGLPALLAKPETWVITLSSTPRQNALDMALSRWSAVDRTYAILTGYTTFIVLGYAYVRKGSPFSSSATGREWEALIIDILNQAGGVLKVILIISIEMLVFPLYCGLLLDVATLPLFEGATLMSRVVFGLKSPFTSMFVHWFVGTCYMFHFALFVSMCRKILRKGTLYFIRDPDDPTFHPVRDVLERNVTTQLRKITFSAAVYGALVLVCLGGVVWSLAAVFRGVLPIRWSSNEPVLEFPIDLLFYNFLMPLAVKYFRPSEGLHKMYKWWFYQSAHFLRLSHFLLGERRLNEELWPAKGNSRRVGEMSEEEMKAVIEGLAVNPPDAAPLTAQDTAVAANAETQWINKGRYVRAPASDMVRIPKSTAVFLPVNSKNERLDGQPELNDHLHGINNKLFQMVYNPPQFRLRIGIFIVALWGFAAVTGCGATLVPLVLGRRIFARVLPEEVQKNDVYAFAMGANLLGSLFYFIYHLRTCLNRLYDFVIQSDPLQLVSTAVATTWRTTKLIYAYTSFIGLCPALLALLIEFYGILPLHSFIVPGETHTIHFVQSWTLGLLMFNLARRFLLSQDYGFGDSRAAVALRLVVRRGYGDLDVGLATRGFILPITLISLIALALPAVGAGAAVKIGVLKSSVKVYRNAYPFAMALALGVVGMITAVKKLGEWRMKVRDEVYLIGERLHNFNEAGKKGKGKAVLGGNGMVNRIET